MARLLDHLWSKILGCSAVSLGSVILVKHFGETEVNDFEIAIHVDKDVFKFEIPVYNSFLMKISQSHCNLSSIELYLMLLESTLSFEESVELSTSDKRHDKEEPKITHKEVLHANQELVLAFEHDVFFQLCVFNLVVLYQNIFPDNFDSV